MSKIHKNNHSDRLTVLCLADRDCSEGRYSISHPILEDVLARSFPERGHKVIWALHKASNMLRERVSWHNSDIYLLPSCGSSRYRKIRITLWRLIFLRNYLLPAIKECRVDAIYIRNDWAAMLAVRNLQRDYGIPIIFQWSFPHHLIHSARVQDGLEHYPWLANVRARIEKRLYIQALHLATHGLPISKWMASWLADQGIPAEKMTPFPLGFNTEITINPVDVALVKERYNLTKEPVVVYIGDMGRLRQMEFLIEVISKVKRRVPRVRLLMVGAGDTGADLEYLRNMAAHLGLQDQVVFTGFLPRQEVPAYVAAADVGVSPIRPIPLYLMSSPAKLLEYMGMSRPVVANDIPEQRELLQLSGGGICVPYDVFSFADAIVKILQSPKKAQEMGRRGRVFVEKYRSIQALSDLLENVFYKSVYSACNGSPALEGL